MHRLGGDLHVEGPHVVRGSLLVLAAAFSYALYLAMSGQLIRRIGSLSCPGGDGTSVLWRIHACVSRSRRSDRL